jgi:acyl-CoA dehydrogenase
MPKVLHDVASRALQVHGSLGASNEMPFGGMVLESFHMGLADGPTQVHKLQVARNLLREYTPSDGLFPRAHLPKAREEAMTRYASAIALAGGHLGPSDELPVSRGR